MNPSSWFRSTVLRIVGGYLLIGGLWIYYSDRLLVWVAGDAQAIVTWSTLKGWFFILFTAALLWALLRHEFKRRDRLARSLRHEQRLLEIMSEVAQVGGWDFDVLTGAGNWTDQVARIHDLDPAAPTSRDVGISFYTKESRARIEAAIERATTNGEPFDLELDLLSATGRRKRVRTRGTPVLSHGRVTRLQGAFQDISRQHLIRERLAALIETIQGLAHARNVADIMQRIRQGARRLSGADGVTVVLNDDGHCYYADEDAIGPLWKGQRFPLEQCISGYAMLHRETVVIEDIYADDRVPHDAYRPTFVKSLAMLPVNRNEPIGALGFYWATNYTPPAEELELLSTLADATAIAMDNARHIERLEAEIADHAKTRSRLHLQSTALEATERAVLITDTNGQIEWANPAFARLTGYSLEESMGQSMRLFRSGTHSAQFYKDLWQTILNGRSWQGTLVNRRKNGTEYVEEQTITPVYDGDRIAHFISIKDDISSRVNQTQEMERRERYFRSLIENSHDMITVIDIQGIIVFQSKSVHNILGYQAAEMTGRSVYDFLDPAEVPTAQLALLQALNENILKTMELHIRHADGRYRLLEAIGHPIKWEGQWQLVINARDQTERNSLEAQLAQAQKMESVGQLAGGIAHDFNNILTVINGTAELLLEDLAEDHPLRSDILTVQRAGERAVALTRQLLVFSRRQTMKPLPVNLNRVCDQIHPMLERLIPESIEKICDLEPGLPEVLADPGQMEQLILNLAINARDAMPDGGSLFIRTRLIREPEPRVELLISDTGHGMSNEVRLRAFEPFFTTKEAGKGTGLGLAMVYGIVQQSGGNIELDTAPSAGARFRILLPVAPESSERHPEMETEAELAPAVGARILLVEDDPSVREITERMLRKEGYEVHRLSDPGNLETLERPDLLITDVIMPQMSGPALARLMRERYPDLKVLYMSGYSGEDLSQEMDSGFTDFIHKPFQSQEFLNQVRRLLHPGEGFPADKGENQP